MDCRASTPPAEEWVTSFFTRVKKEVTKKESTWCGAPGFTHGNAERLRRSQLRVHRNSVTAYQSVHLAFHRRRCWLYRRYCLPTVRVLRPDLADLNSSRLCRFAGRKT